MNNDKYMALSVNRILGCLELTGSQNRDEIYLNGCKNAKVNLANDNDKAKKEFLRKDFRSDYISIANSKKNGKLFVSGENEVILGKGDYAVQTDGEDYSFNIKQNNASFNVTYHDQTVIPNNGKTEDLK